MLISTFPDKVDWRKLVLQQASIKADVALKHFTRLTAMLADVGDETLAVELDFSKDAENRSHIQGRLAVEVQLVCQRCLQPMKHVMQGDFDVYLVMSTGQEKSLPKHLDSTLVADEMLDLKELLEDELLLELPFTSYHEVQACDPAFRYNVVEIETNALAEDKESPFAVLELLKKKS